MGNTTCMEEKFWWCHFPCMHYTFCSLKISSILLSFIFISLAILTRIIMSKFIGLPPCAPSISDLILWSLVSNSSVLGLLSGTLCRDCLISSTRLAGMNRPTASKSATYFPRRSSSVLPRTSEGLSGFGYVLGSRSPGNVWNWVEITLESTHSCINTYQHVVAFLHSGCMCYCTLISRSLMPLSRFHYIWDSMATLASPIYKPHIMVHLPYPSPWTNNKCLDMDPSHLLLHQCPMPAAKIHLVEFPLSVVQIYSGWPNIICSFGTCTLTSHGYYILIGEGSRLRPWGHADHSCPLIIHLRSRLLLRSILLCTIS